MGIKELLLRSLDELGKEDLKLFKWHLANISNEENGFSAISKGDLQDAEKHIIVDIMVETFHVKSALEYTLKILREMSKNGLAVTLEENVASLKRDAALVDRQQTESSQNASVISKRNIEVEVPAYSTLSEYEAKADLSSMNLYRSMILRVAQRYGQEPSLISGMISRESRGGKTLKDGWGASGHAWGLMQVDKHWHSIVGGWDSEEHLNQATGILVDIQKQANKMFPHWTRDQQKRAAIAGYNMGLQSIDPNSPERVDDHTSGGEYSRDVLARAQFYKHNGY